MSHSRFAPSAAHAWVNCPGAVRAAELYPSVDTDASREGTAAHYAAQAFAAGRKDVQAGSRTPDGVTVDADMVKGAELYAAEVRGWFEANGGLLALERREDLGEIHKDCFGTPDCTIVGHDRALIADYKYGRSPVDAFQNWQLLAYAVGVRPPVEQYDFIVVQPRSWPPIKKWSCTREDFVQYLQQLKRAALTADSYPEHLVAGEHCRYCTARPHCDAARRYANGLFGVVTYGGFSELPLPAVAVELMHTRAALKALASLESAYAEILEHALTSGQEVQGWQIGTSFGHRKWTLGTPELKAIGLAFGKNLVEEKPITPAEAERLGVPRDVVGPLTEKPTIKKLTRVTDAQLSGVFEND